MTQRGLALFPDFPDLIAARPQGGYRVILADPAWYFRNRSAKGEAKNPIAHYECVPTPDLMALPVEALAAADAALFLWATFPMLPDALAVMEAWGFDYVSGGAWGKRSSTGGKWHFGTGYVFRSACEPFLVGRRGKPKVQSHSVRNLIVTDDIFDDFTAWIADPVREHSRKPDATHVMIETLFAPPRLELFARQRRPGWTVWGKDLDKFPMAEDVSGSPAE